MKHIFTALLCTLLAAGVFAAPCFDSSYSSQLTTARSITNYTQETKPQVEEYCNAQLTKIFPMDNEFT